MPVADVGDEATVTREITAADIETYAELTGDDNPLHTDEEYAADGFFGGLVAHRMLGAGIVGAALGKLPGDVVQLSQELSFEAPIEPGDTVRATAEVVAKLGNGQVRVVTIAQVGEGEEAEQVITGSAVVISTSRGA